MTGSKKIFVVWGSSDVGGHAPASSAKPLPNGEHVFVFADGVFEQNPAEPVFGPNDGTGSTPLRYFADKLAGETGDDIAFMVGGSAAGDWHVGIERLTHSAINGAIAKLQPALDAGWELGGIILAIGPGDADTWREVQTYEQRFHSALNRLRADFHDNDLLVVNAQTWMPRNPDYNDDMRQRVSALRHEMADVGKFHNVEVALSSPSWHGLPGHSGSSHLDVSGQVLFGHAMADAVFNFWF